MSDAVAPPADGGVANHLSAIARIEQDLRTRRDAVAARLEAMGAAMYVYTYEIVYTVGFVRVTLPLNDKGIPVEDYARMVDAAERVLAGLEAAKAERPMTAAEVEAVVDRALPLGVPAGDAIAGSEAAKAEPDPAEPSAGDVADAQDSTPDGLVGLAAWEAGVAPLSEDGDVWPPAVMAAARAWAVATGEEADRLGRQLRSLCGSDMEVIAVKATACAEIADLERTEALADRDRARQQRDEAEAKLSAIADLLNEDEERSPSYDRDDKPIPLVDRVRVALMPDGFGQSAWERRTTKILDQYGAPVAFGSEIPASPYGRVVRTAQALKEERERAKEYAQEIYDAGRVLTILGAPPHLPLREALMRVLSPEDRRAVLEVEAAEARAALVRVRALRVDPAAPGVVAEYEARAAAAQAALNELPAGEEG